MRQTLAALSVLLLTSLSCSPTASALVLQQPGAPVTGSPIEHELTQLDHHQQQQHAGSAGSERSTQWLLGFPWPSMRSPPEMPPRDASRVPVQLGVMSKCPDAHVCEATFDRVVEQVSMLIDLDLLYIANVTTSSSTSTSTEVECMHGESECTGNIHQLCARKHFETKDKVDKPYWRDWWNFVQCVNYGPASRVGDLAVAKECAKVAGHNWREDGAADCVNSSEGASLLAASARAAASSGLTRSCTVVINGRHVCVRDGGVWKDCDAGHEVGDFVRQVKDEWKRINVVAGTVPHDVDVGRFVVR